jgi:WD40 repeat protein
MKTSANVVDVHRLTGDQRCQSSVMSLRYTCDGKYVFQCSSSGTIAIGADGQRPQQFLTTTMDDLDGCTCVRLADVPADTETGAYTMAATTSSGRVSLWSVVPGKSHTMIAMAAEDGNEIMTCAFAYGRTDTIITGGADTCLRLYKLVDGNLEMVQKIDQGIDRHGQPTLGPPSKVMATVFVDENTLLVGGWEASVLLYDLRTREVQRTFAGPRLSGDTLDFSQGCVLAASHRPTNQLQLFDLGSSKELANMTVDTLPFACRLFGRASKMGAWVAGTSPNAVYAVSLLRGEVIASVTDVPEALYALDVCPTDPARVTVGGAKDSTYRVRVELP